MVHALIKWSDGLTTPNGGTIISLDVLNVCAGGLELIIDVAFGDDELIECDGDQMNVLSIDEL